MNNTSMETIKKYDLLINTKMVEKRLLIVWILSKVGLIERKSYENFKFNLPFFSMKYEVLEL